MKKFLTLGFAAATAMALATGCQKKEAAAPESCARGAGPGRRRGDGHGGDHQHDDDRHGRPPRPDHDDVDRDRPGDDDARPPSTLFRIAILRGSRPGASFVSGRARVPAPATLVAVLPLWVDAILLCRGCGGRACARGSSRAASAASGGAPPGAANARATSSANLRTRRRSCEHAYRGGLRDPAALGLRPLPRRSVSEDLRGLDARRRSPAEPQARRATPRSPYLGELHRLPRAAAVRRHRDRPLLRPDGAAARDGAPTQRLHLPLYSGDVLVAYLTLVSPEPIDEQRKAEIRAPARAADGLAPRLPQLGDRRDRRALRPFCAPLLRDPPGRGVGAAPPLRVARLGRALRPRPLQEDQRHARARRRRPRPSAGSARSCAPPCARATSPAATAARSSPCSFPETGCPLGPGRRRPRARARSSASASRAREGRSRSPSRPASRTPRARSRTSATSCSSARTRRSTPPRTRAATASRLWTERRRAPARTPLPETLAALTRGARAGGGAATRRPGRRRAGVTSGSRSSPPPAGPSARPAGRTPSSPERAAALPREPRAADPPGVAHASPAAASRAAIGPSQSRSAARRPPRLPHRAQGVGPRPGQPQRDAERLGPRGA